MFPYNQKFRTSGRLCAFLLAVATLMTCFVILPVPVSAADPDYTFSSGAVLIDSSYDGKNILIKHGVFSVTVSGAKNVNIMFDAVTMDRRYASDTSGTVEKLYEVATKLGWGSGTTYYAQTCPLLITNNADVSVAFRGGNYFYAGTNRCTVNSSDWYTKDNSGGGFAGIQVDAGSTLTIEPSGGSIHAYGGYWVDTDNSNNVPNNTLFKEDNNGYGYPSGASQNALAGGGGIGGVAWNTTTCVSSSYTAGTPGTIIINGGSVYAYGGHQAAGIGGGLNGAATVTSITINGGTVSARGGRWAAGIGDGDSLQDNYTRLYGDPYAIVINGGTVEAVGGVAFPGIGSTDDLAKYSRTSGLEIMLNGGTITARSGYPDHFNPGGSTGYTGTDAAAAIGAGNTTNMASNSITIASAAKVIASGFGHYSITENGVSYDTAPTVNIDSDGYMFLGRFPELASSKGREFTLYEAQIFDAEYNGYTYQYTKYVTQPEDGSAGEIYYYAPEAPAGGWLVKAGEDGSLEKGTVVALADVEALKTTMDKLLLAPWIDGTSVEIDTVKAPAFFRSIAISLPDPGEHGGIYALKIPVESMYGYTGQAALPVSGFAVITIDAREQGTLSGAMTYPNTFNIEFDSVSETLTDLDVYPDAPYTDGRNGLIGDAFHENVYAYKIYIEHDADKAYIYARYSSNPSAEILVEAFDNVTLTTTQVGSDFVVTGLVDMNGVTEKTIRLKKTDTYTTKGNQTFSPSPVVYKITIVKKANYEVKLYDLTKIYDGAAVNPNIMGLISPDNNANYVVPTEEERALAVYTYYVTEGTIDTPLSEAPKNAGSYKVKIELRTATYTATGEHLFTISQRPLTVNRIENALTYVTAAEHNSWASIHFITEPGTLYLVGVVGSDDVTASAASVYYNDITIGYKSDKITLTGLTLSGNDADNYTIAKTQRVFGQISYSLNGAIFRKKPGQIWDKFYPVDSKTPVDAGSADYHSPMGDNGAYDSHGEYVYARTENMGDKQTVYAVDIEFGDMYFTYSRSQWNPDSMMYEELVGESRWSGFDGVRNRVEVKNRSNTLISYIASCKIDFLHSSIGESDAGIRAGFYQENSATSTVVTDRKQQVGAASAGGTGGYGTATVSRCYLILSGVPQLPESDSFTVVGKLYVTVSAG